MKTTIDSAGRIVIPKKLRDEAGFQPGMELEVRYCHGHVEVEAAEVPYHIEDRDGWLVVVPDRPVPPLTNEMVRRTLEEIRAERGMIHDEDYRR
jgi:AbrB family looped-hinge helix DNA binding protein